MGWVKRLPSARGLVANETALGVYKWGVTSGSDESPPRPESRLPEVGAGLAPARRHVGLALVVLGLPLMTSLLVEFRGALALASMLLLYLLAVVVIAVVGGILPAVLAAVVSFLLANWFLTPPFHTLKVASRDSVIELGVFLLVALAVSITVDVAARRRMAAVRGAMEAERLERRLADEAARARELATVDRLRSALLAAVGHELRTPLAGAKAAVSSLRQQDITWTADERDGLLLTIEESTDRLAELIANLLDLSRLQAGAVSVQPVPVSVDEIVASALTDARHRHVENRVPDELPLVVADPGLLERVLVNLVDNAQRFSPPGKAVVVTAEVHDSGSVALRVADHGPGVPEGRWDRLFVPFQRLDDRSTTTGLGLGLAIAQGFVEAMDGTIEPSATPGGGLTMTVTLPVAP